MTIWTIGHSTRTLDELLALLAPFEVQAVADVRRHPGSRRQPWFLREALEASLPPRGFKYRWIPALGGRRRARPDSTNDAWRNASFRGYADYIETPEFADGLEVLLDLARQRRTAMMCAEILWWRCHRALIADVLKFRGIEVVHILDEKHAVAHPYTSAARIVDARLSYAAPESGTAAGSPGDL
ncbi:MAG TPA: DUF488 domain-containing protein [Steroidobacteraceae bacterium]|nr:DUF488 domain-containing protein [Steroidobacteraceae bacterium]